MGDVPLREVPLGEVATIERDGVDPESLDPETPYLGLEHLDRGGRIIGRDTVSGAGLTSTKFRFTSDHVLFGKLRPNLGKISRPDFDGVCSTDILPIRPGRALDRDYLAHFLSQPSIVAMASSQATGANLPRLSPAVLAKFPIPLPPLAEQRRIATILDHADALRAKRRQVLDHLDSLPQAIFHAMFGDPVRNGMDLATASLGSLARVVTGNSPPRSDPSNFGDDVEWIKSDNLGGTVASAAEERLSQLGRFRARIAPVGSILVTCIAGSPTSIGKASLVDREVAFNQQINAILPSEAMDALFLLGQLRAAPELVRSKSTGGMKGLVNKSAFQSIELLVPPLSEQRDFAARYVRIIDQSEKTGFAVEATDGLFASLQSRVFQGALTA